jgi:hypothetical protein
MKLILCCFFALILASYAQADIYKYEEDSTGDNHFTDQPTDDRFKIFAPDRKTKKEKSKGTPRVKEKEPIADKYLFNATSADGSVWAVRTTRGRLRKRKKSYAKQIVTVVAA